ncbi:hypothetical protein KGQ64_13215 [bacterium]|nr:hypothetical protein [bacterium]
MGSPASPRSGGAPADPERGETTDPRIAELARQLNEAIEAAEATGQAGARETAIEVLKEPARERALAERQAEGLARAASRGMNPFALGLPLLPVGVFMFFLFPPVGLLIFLLGLGSCLAGAVQAMVGSIRGRIAGGTEIPDQVGSEAG